MWRIKMKKPNNYLIVTVASMFLCGSLNIKGNEPCSPTVYQKGAINAFKAFCCNRDENPNITHHSDGYVQVSATTVSGTHSICLISPQGEISDSFQKTDFWKFLQYKLDCLHPLPAYTLATALAACGIYSAYQWYKNWKHRTTQEQ